VLIGQLVVDFAFAVPLFQKECCFEFNFNFFAVLLLGEHFMEFHHYYLSIQAEVILL
jgi:hypothetical protein